MTIPSRTRALVPEDRLRGRPADAFWRLVTANFVAGVCRLDPLDTIGDDRPVELLHRGIGSSNIDEFDLGGPLRFGHH